MQQVEIAGLDQFVGAVAPAVERIRRVAEARREHGVDHLVAALRTAPRRLLGDADRLQLGEEHLVDEDVLQIGRQGVEGFENGRRIGRARRLADPRKEGLQLGDIVVR